MIGWFNRFIWQIPEGEFCQFWISFGKFRRDDFTMKQTELWSRYLQKILVFYIVDITKTIVEKLCQFYMFNKLERTEFTPAKIDLHNDIYRRFWSAKFQSRFHSANLLAVRSPVNFVIL